MSNENRVKRGVVLDVPFKEKNEAKQLGAWWDPEMKKWFVPEGKDLQIFEKWIPKAQQSGSHA